MVEGSAHCPFRRMSNGPLLDKTFNSGAADLGTYKTATLPDVHIGLADPTVLNTRDEFQTGPGIVTGRPISSKYASSCRAIGRILQKVGTGNLIQRPGNRSKGTSFLIRRTGHDHG